jgi:hypothetical protein
MITKILSPLAFILQYVFKTIDDSLDHQVQYEVPKLTFHFTVYLFFFGISLFFPVLAIFYGAILFKNLFLTKYRPYYLKEIEDFNYKLLLNNDLIKKDGKYFQRIYSKEKRKADNNIRGFWMAKGLAAILIIGLVLKGNEYISPSSSKFDIDQTEKLNQFKRDSKKSFSVPNSLDLDTLPSKVVVSFPAGTRMFTDTTVNYEVIQEYLFGDTLTCINQFGFWFICVKENKKGYISKKHVKPIY